ncbi:MAG: hypothetical protein JXA71_14935 [Chitinispirillaceae bacterium]|nr:hypothetical protein [Chitinispirillaceae bacterium]
MIPQTIHFYWSGGMMPNKYKECINTWRPCEIKIWTPKELNIDIDLPVNFQSDIARWKILLENGGIYCDCDMYRIGMFGLLLNTECFAVKSGYMVQMMNCFVGCEKKNTLIERLLVETNKKIYGKCLVIDLCKANSVMLEKCKTVLETEYCPIVMGGKLNTPVTKKTIAIHKHFMGWKPQTN